MKRKGSNIDEEREAKRSKLDPDDLSTDALREIFKYLSDVDIIRVARVAKNWNKVSHSERSRFITQRIARLKLVNGIKIETDSRKLDEIINKEITALKKELDALTAFRKENSKALPVIERFEIWRTSLAPKEHFPYRQTLAPEGEVDIWEMGQFAKDSEGYYKGRTFELDELLEVVEEHLEVRIEDLRSAEPETHQGSEGSDKDEKDDKGDEEEGDEDDEDDEDEDPELSERLAQLEKYLLMFMQLNLGSVCNDW